MHVTRTQEACRETRRTSGRAPEHNQTPTLADPEAILNEPWIGGASIRRLSSKRFVNEVQHQMRRGPCGRSSERCELRARTAR